MSRRSLLCLTTLAFAAILCQAQGYITTTVTAGGTPAQHATGPNKLPHNLGPGVLALDSSGSQFVAVRDGIFKIDDSGAPMRVAGTQRQWRYSGDGGQAIRARLNPRSVALDAAGNLYLADSGNNRIRKVAAATGVITTVAGNGLKGFSGDGGAAVDAELDGPTGVTLDAGGNLYIADGITDGNIRIRRVAAGTGVITTIAGNGSQGYSGDGGIATSAQLSSLGGLAADASGNLYLADNFNNRIRKVSAATGIITTVAGSGVAGHAGDGGLATSAQLNNPLDMVTDAAGNLYIADSYNFRIRKVAAATGMIATLVNGGNDTSLVYSDTQHGFPCSIAADASGNLYIADFGTSRIRRVPAGTAILSVGDLAATPILRSQADPSGFTINVTYGDAVPSAAQTAFNSIVSTYESVFSGANVTVNLTVDFGDTSLGQSDTEFVEESYFLWRKAMLANAAANSGNSYNMAAAASLPASDPIGLGTVAVRTANARTLGFSANVPVDSALTFNNSTGTFEYTGVATPGVYDFLDVATHELDEGLGIGSALTGLANNASLPTNDYEAEDYFRYSATPGTRDITTNPNAAVYFSYDGSTDVAQFNQSYSDEGLNDLDRNDWIYGNFGCPAEAPGPYIQDAIGCPDEAVAVGQTGSPEVIVLNSLGFNPGSLGTTPQTITFNPLSNVTFGVAPFSINATASSGLMVSFASTTMPVCTVSGNTVTIVAAGSCSITASQPGNATYAAAPSVTQTFTVNQAAQTITFNAPGNVSFGVAPFTITATASSGLSVSFASTTMPVCTVSGNTVTIVAAGSCSITASQPGNATYAAAPSVTQTFTVNQATQTITFNAPGNVSFGVAPFTITATASSGLSVSFASTTMSVCTVSGSTVTIVAGGSCSITASQPGNANYTAAASVSQSFTVNQGTQSITFNALGNVPFGVAPFAVSATASSGLPVSFTSTTMPVCTVSGSTVTIAAVGTCSITATQPGNANYTAAASVSQSFTVNPATQTITFNAPGNVSFGVAPFAITATASSGLPVSFASTTTPVCSVSGSTVTIVAAGTCSITASQPGNANYTAAVSVSRSFTVNQGAQSITFSALGNVAFGVVPFAITATASSVLPVSFASTTIPVCTVSGSTVTIAAAGTCSIIASQAGSANYAAAVSVTQSFIVNPTTTAGTLQFYAIPPCRLVDTRGAAVGFNGISPFSGPSLPGGGTLTIPVQSATEAGTNTTPAPCGLIPSTAQAYSFNLTVVPKTGGAVDYVSLWPAGSPQPFVATLNDPQGLIVANAAIVPAGSPSGGISVFNAGPASADVIIDMSGYFAPPSTGLEFYPVAPCRLVDTRGAAAGFNGIDPFGGPSIPDAGTLMIPVQSVAEAGSDTEPAPCGVIPSNAEAYSLNLTVVPVVTGGPVDYVSMWPAGEPQPFVSTLDDPQGLISANAAIVPAGTPSGGVSVYNDGPSATDVVIDMNGYFAPPATGLQFYPVAPCRLVDTRGAAAGFNGVAPFAGPSIPGGGMIAIPMQSTLEAVSNTEPAPCGVIPSSAQAYSINLTVVPAEGGPVDYVSLWPAGSPQPFVATLNDPQGLIVANAAIVPAGSPFGGISVFNAGPSTTDVVIDMNGYFAAPPD